MSETLLLLYLNEALVLDRADVSVREKVMGLGAVNKGARVDLDAADEGGRQKKH